MQPIGHPTRPPQNLELTTGIATLTQTELKEKYSRYILSAAGICQSKRQHFAAAI